MQNLPHPLLVAIDAPMLVFQSYYGIPDSFHDAQGRSVNAVLGFTLRMLELLGQSWGNTHNDDTVCGQGRVVLCWDESLGSGFRHRLYAPYKANRPLADEAFIYQLQRCAEVGEAMGLAQFASTEFEADDLIASLVHWQHVQGAGAMIVSQDKDLAQIVGAWDRWWAFPKQSAWTQAELLAHWQMPLARIADYLALCGDAVDNIPGVKGVGAVTARVLMQTFASLEMLFDNVAEVGALPLRGAAGVQKKLVAQREEVFLFRELTRLRGDALGVEDWRGATLRAAQGERFREVMVACGLWGRVKNRAQGYFGGF